MGELDWDQQHDRDLSQLQAEEQLLELVLRIQSQARLSGQACEATLNAKMDALLQMNALYQDIAPVLAKVDQVKLDVAKLQSLQDRQDSSAEDPSPFLRKVLRDARFFKDEH